MGREERHKLVVPFYEEEIKLVMWDCEGDKSPIPNGYNFSFIKHFWDLLKGDIVAMMHDFHSCGKLPRGVNASFIALIRKVDNPQGLGEYRPISLIGCIYKIIAKEI